MFELGTDGPKDILVAVDGSDASMRAAAYAAGLARRQNCRLVVVFVHSTGGMASMRPESVVGMEQTNVETGRELQKEIEEHAGRLGVSVTLIQRHGDPADEIAKVADELRVDAVLVGASARVGHRFVGAVGVHLVKLARWPVTVVP